MQYHVSRDGHQMGQVSEADLKAGLLDGRYHGTDLIWREGMGEWKRLSEMNWPTLAARSEPARESFPGGRVSGAAAAVRSPASAAAAAPNPAFTPSPRSTAPAFAAGAPVPPGLPRASGLAVTSLISGILSIIACSVCGIGTLMAIICGHMSLSRISRSGGTMGGRGMAITGLILGYVSILTSLIGASLAFPVISKIQEQGEIQRHIALAREVQVACKIYALENEGKYPASLDELVEKNFLEADRLQKANDAKPSSWEGERGFEYHGAGLDDTVPDDTKILISKAADKRGRRIVAHHSGAVILDKLE